MAYEYIQKNLDAITERIRAAEKAAGREAGSVAMIAAVKYAEDGEIVACLVGGDSATVKRFRKINKKLFLYPENEDYKPISLTPEEFESGDARILGVAVEVKIKL